jgi:hypothetical protein
MTTALEGGEESASRPGRSLPPVSIVLEAGWAPGPVWTGAENLAPTGIRSPDRPARSQSLYRPTYLVMHTQIYVATPTTQSLFMSHFPRVYFVVNLYT